MQVNSTVAITKSKTEIAHTLRELAKNIESGDVHKYEFNRASCGQITMKIDSVKHPLPQVECKKKRSNDLRRKRVKDLVLAGYTHSQIANKTMFSPTAISEDIQILRQRGEVL